METYTTIVLFFQKGGFFMYPIAIIFGIGMAIAIERYIYLTVMRATNRRLWNQLMPLLRDGRLREAQQMISKSKSALSRIVAYGLARISRTHRRDDLETAMEEGLMEVMPRLEKRTPYLATFANLATLLGLLGTIIGLIKAFTAVANADPSVKADLLSSSISVAMNTTAFGLIVAIPLLLIYSVIQAKTTEIVDSLEMATVKFVNTVHEQKPASQAAPK